MLNEFKIEEKYYAPNCGYYICRRCGCLVGLGYIHIENHSNWHEQLDKK